MPIGREFEREYLGQGFQYKVYTSRNKSRVLKVPRYQWMLIEYLMKDRKRERQKRSIELIQEYLSDFYLDTRVKFGIVSQTRIYKFKPLNNSSINIKEIHDSLVKLSEQCSLLYKKTGYIVDLIGTTAFRLNFLMRDQAFWCFPNVVKNTLQIPGKEKILISDTYLFDYSENAGLIDRMTTRVLVPATNKMFERVGIQAP